MFCSQLFDFQRSLWSIAAQSWDRNSEPIGSGDGGGGHDGIISYSVALSPPCGQMDVLPKVDLKHRVWTSHVAQG